MIEIEPTTFSDTAPFGSVFDPPYLNLQPIVDLLIASGNETLDGGFRPTQGGWVCVFAHEIDTELIRRTFSLPDTVKMSQTTGAILDRMSWCQIYGPSR